MKKSPIPFPPQPGGPSIATMRAFVATYWNIKADAMEAMGTKIFRQAGEARALAKSADVMPDSAVKAVYEALQREGETDVGANVVEPNEGVN